MRKLLALCAVVLFLAVAASAQENSGPLAVASEGSASAAPRRISATDVFPWEVGVSYQFIRFKIAGNSMNMHGFNTSATRFFGDWFGLEGDVSGAWGNTPTSKLFPTSTRSKLAFYGGGVRIAARQYQRFEPWFHGLVGGMRLLPQTALGSRNAYGVEGGAGVDFRLGPRVSWRVQSDYVGSHFFSTWQHNWQVKTGIVFNF